MKSVMISIKPKWCELIASDKKTIEVRRNRPKLETPFKCYIYCTKSKPLIGNYEGHIFFMDEGDFDYYNKNTIFKCNGKVLGEFVCDTIDEIALINTPVMEYIRVNGKASMTITSDTCMNINALSKYADGKQLYGWHISDLKVYDKPKELKRFGRFECEYCGSKKECFAPETIYDCSLQRIDTHQNNNNMYRCDGDFLSLKRPPQSWCYVEENANTYKTFRYS